MNKHQYLEDIKFDSMFFMDEVREGFFVSSMMKRFWAAQISILSEINRICKKYKIKWFADYGTLIGAIRHGGFIPWDDDLDICMLRNDYNLFFDVAKRELPKSYRVLDVKLESEYEHLLGRITNSQAIEYSDKHLFTSHGCPYTYGVDIFPLDVIPDDINLRENWKKNLLTIANAITLIDSGGLESIGCKNLLDEIERQNHVILHRHRNVKRELILLTDKLYQKYSSVKSSYVAMMPFWVKYGDHEFGKNLFDDYILKPFENIYISVPACYNEVLKIEYGDYMQVYKSGGIHDYPVYREQEEILKNAIGKNPFRFTLNKNLIIENKRPESLRTVCNKIIATLFRAHDEAELYAAIGDTTKVFEILTGCQELTIALGTKLEESVKGKYSEESKERYYGTSKKAYSGDADIELKDCEKIEKIVHLLEEYCELLFVFGNNWETTSKTVLDEKILTVENELISYFENKRKEVLFLPCKADWWDTMDFAWKRASFDPAWDAYVISVPYAIRDIYGDGTSYKYDDISKLPSYVKTVTIEEYDISKRHPDAIIIQNPYDEWSSILNEPEFFYSKNLLKYTDELVYIPCYEVDDPSYENDKTSIALETLIEQPAVLYADKVLVKTEKLRNLYIDFLAKKTGENKEYWEKKISIESESLPFVSETNLDEYDEFESENIKKTKKYKTIVFRVNAAFLLEHREKALNKISWALDQFDSFETQSAGDVIDCSEKNYITEPLEMPSSYLGRKISFIYSPDEDMESVSEIDSELWNEYLKVIGRINNSKNVKICKDYDWDKDLDIVDAYYGTAGVLAHKCRNKGIPVMLMNCDIL